MIKILWMFCLITGVLNYFNVSLSEDESIEISIESQRSTSRELVGLQLWRGAFLLAEYLCFHPELTREAVILELAAGTGFASIVASLTAKSVICTGKIRSF